MFSHLCAHSVTYKRKVQKVTKCLRNFSKISSSDILGFFFCFSVFRVRASGGVVLFSVGEIGDVAASRVGVTGRGSITDRVYTCVVGARIWQDQSLLAQRHSGASYTCMCIHIHGRTNPNKLISSPRSKSMFLLLCAQAHPLWVEWPSLFSLHTK